ncbi:nitrate reductase molybdenum cofactor assembly chaperone [Tepidibacillus sp. HK-1]|uniref:nitrate reductase molybdenum cofactor assembly chaperone n=1 Tax=Tepidibacillus sp. HK-1 TaxID=1883407 RepID=UPI000853EC13|nr:nitrate reductase molybdenum cofactor assembly chaperone [Tepidibacillus sp. HK-1]GBF11159.1 putative nitrate reductase molybdenum cofactor assembly chaperone NarW [Tepidibacillus sp. HK-1]
MENTQLLFKLCSLFLQYPEESWVRSKDLNKIIQFLNNGKEKESLKEFKNYLDHHHLEDLCERYVQTFDFNEKTALYLTYFQHKDQKERGPALLQLKDEYRKAGFYLESSELPDYLPVILEFLAIAPYRYWPNILYSQKENIEKLYKELANLQSPYQFVVGASLDHIQSLMQPELTGGVL